MKACSNHEVNFIGGELRETTVGSDPDEIYRNLSHTQEFTTRTLQSLHTLPLSL